MLRIYQSNRLERLVDLLVEVQSEIVAPPLTGEILVVPHQGTARWLQLDLARRRGICANLRFPLPAAFVWDMFRTLVDGVPERNGYAPDVLVWRFWACLDHIGDGPLWEPIRRYLSSGSEALRYQLAVRLSEVFDRYLVYRPDWIDRWEAGEEAVPGDEWQAELWRRVRSGFGGEHWLELHRRLCQRLNRGAINRVDLPGSVSIFGLSNLSPGFLDILNRLSEVMDLHLYLLNPCREYWTEIVDTREKARREIPAGFDDLYLDVGNPLLASMGRQGRDVFASLLERDPGSVEQFEDPGTHSILAMVQSEILNLAEPGTTAGREPVERDESLQFHSCHSPMREIEVLRDWLLDLLGRFPDLQPSDVLVMAPDIEDYAPYVETVFEHQPGMPSIPFNIADRNLAAQNPLIETFFNLLDLPESRLDSNSLLGLLEIKEVQDRFGIGETDLHSIRHWVEAATIRWGRDAAFRSTLGLPATKENSWRNGLDRLLLGYALPEVDRRRFLGVLPCEVVEGSEAVLLGSLAEFAETVFEFQERLASRNRLGSWEKLLIELMERFFKTGEDAKQDLQILREAITDSLRQAGTAGFDGPVAVEIVKMHLKSQIARRADSHRYLGEGVTFCSLIPSRSLPFEVICLLGMNDGRFPRDTSGIGFNLLARDHRLGDRSRRTEDRYLFLETLVSTRRCFYVSFIGQDIRDASPLPPCTLVGELLDYLASLLSRAPAGGWDRDRLVTVHPLQGFSPAYFSPGTPLFSYSREMFETCRALQRSERKSRPFVASDLEPAEPEWREVHVEQLTEFFANPARYFIKYRSGVRLESPEELLETREPFTLDPFERFALTSELVQAYLKAKDTGEVAAALEVAGSLPHGRIGKTHLQSLVRSAGRFARELEALGSEEPVGPLEIGIQLGEMRLSGWLSGVQRSGILGFSVHRLWERDLLALWVRHLVVNVLAPPGVEKGSRWRDETGLLRLHPVEGADVYLSALLDLYWRGLHKPLHFFPRSSRAYAERMGKGGDREIALKSARAVWFGDHVKGHPEFSNDYYRLAFPDGDTLDPAFERLSSLVYEPLFAHMESR